MNKGKIVFYSKKEVEEMKVALKSGIKPATYAKLHAREMNRSEAAVANKMLMLSKEGISTSEADTSAYSDEQIMMIKNAIFRGDKPSAIVDRYAKRWKRRRPGFLAKVYLIRREMIDKPNRKPDPIVKVKEPAPAKVIQQQEKKDEGITLPKGFVFEGTPKKVVLFSDHFRVYF